MGSLNELSLVENWARASKIICIPAQSKKKMHLHGNTLFDVKKNAKKQPNILKKKPLKVSAFQHSYVDSAILIHTDDWAEFQWCDNNGFPSPNSYTYESKWIYNFISSKICILSRLVNAFLIPNILQRCWLFHF